MIFENEFDYDNWFEANEEKEGGHDFIEDRVVIVKGTRTIQNRKFNGFSADATINCKNVKTAIRRFIKELKSNGFNVSEDEFESNVHCFTDCGYVVEIEEIDDDRFYINYMCYQNEVEEEATEPETATEQAEEQTAEEPKAEDPETATAEATVEKVWTVTQFPHVVRTFDKSGKMIYETFFETAEKAYEEYVDIIENEKKNLPYGKELIVTRFAYGMLMCRETIKGTCIYPNQRIFRRS